MLCSFLERALMNTKKMSQDIVLAIIDFINEKRSEATVKVKYPNVLLRADVLKLLDEYCTVIYYPLENETNNGFHITGLLDKHGVEKHFVYINTNQTIEKQVFTAAHELGHVWNVDKHVAERCGIELNDDLSEAIINRFAAELLMPEEVFVPAFLVELDKHPNTNGSFEFMEALKISAELITLFFAPHKAVVHRWFELGAINETNAHVLWGDGEYSKAQIDEWIKQIMAEKGYPQFVNPSNTKWIDKLPQLLDQAARSNRISPGKIEEFRNLFQLSDTGPVTNQVNETIDLTNMKEDE